MKLQTLKRIDDPDYAYLGGVCPGIAYSLAVPTWIVRVSGVLTLLFIDKFGITVGLYILLWLMMPEWPIVPKDYAKTCE